MGMVLECTGEGSDFSVGTMCQELSRRNWREIIIHNTSQRLSEKVTVGRLVYQVQKICRAGKNQPQKLTLKGTQTSSLTCWDRWPVLCTGAAAVEEAIMAAVQLCSSTAYSAHRVKQIYLDLWPWVLIFLLGRRSTELDPFLSCAGWVNSGPDSLRWPWPLL